jgi:hypothetical protein
MFDFNGKFDAIDSSDVGTELRRFFNLILEGAAKFGRDITHAPRYKGYFEEVDFVGLFDGMFVFGVAVASAKVFLQEVC